MKNLGTISYMECYLKISATQGLCLRSTPAPKNYKGSIRSPLHEQKCPKNCKVIIDFLKK